jgi:hypothetical protein
MVQSYIGKLGSSVLDEGDKDASDSDDEDDDPVPPPGLFVIGGCEAVVISFEDPVLDPRVYFPLCTKTDFKFYRSHTSISFKSLGLDLAAGLV